MPQSITIQVGQCGNQVGFRFWEMALREHAFHNSEGWFDESMNSFFRNGQGVGSKIRQLRARGIMVDMEEGVLNEFKSNNPAAFLFDSHQKIADVSGSGNNWGTGYFHYGTMYKSKLLEVIRKEAELCDSLQSFFLLHSLGGGTGSGLGSYILDLLHDHYPEVFRMSFCTFPSEDDDVITSPYNSLLAVNSLIEHCDCVFPVENQKLSKICESQSLNRTRERNFDEINGLVASLILHISSSMRFEGPLNVDLNDVVMNLVPFPKMQFLISSLSSNRKAYSNQSLDSLFKEVFSSDQQSISADPRFHTYLSCGLLARGNLELWDIKRNVEVLRGQLTFAPWNQDGWKIGICSKTDAKGRPSLLSLSNNSCFHTSLTAVTQRFSRLFNRKAHLYHYLEYLGETDFIEASQNLFMVAEQYKSLSKFK